MKQVFFIILFFIVINYFSQEIELTKINDTTISQTYPNCDSAILDSDKIFALSRYGLEICQIESNGNLNTLSQTPIPFNVAIAKKDNYVYITSSIISYQNQSSKVFQIDISDSNNPTIIEEINLDYSSISVKTYGNYLNVICFNFSNNIYHNYFYSLPEFELISHCQNQLNFSEKINESTCIRFDGDNQFTVFDLSDPTQLIVIGNGDISSQHQYNAQRVKVYNDTILVATNNLKITFWNISNLNNWQFISQYSPTEDISNMYLPLIIDEKLLISELGALEAIDISDIWNPIQIDWISISDAGSFTKTLIENNEDLYLTSEFNGIQHFKFANNQLSFIGNYFINYLSSRNRQIGNYLLAGSISHYIKGYDIANPQNFNDFGELITDYWSIYEVSNNKLAMLRNNDFNYYVYDISNINSPVLTNQIDCIAFNECCFDETDEESFYVLDPNNNLKKYDISDFGFNVQLFNYDLPFTIEDWIIHEGYGYFLENISTYNQKLHIYHGLNSNQPELSNSINNFVTNPNAKMAIKGSKLVIYNDFLLDFSQFYSTKLFNLNDPINPEMDLELQAFGEPFLTDEVIFVSSDDECCVFENLGNSSDILEPISIITDVAEVNYIALKEFGNQNYVVLCQFSHNGVFSYEYTPVSSENEIPVFDYKLSNYPNPFNPSTEIRFQISDFRQFENTEITIYNLKGQKVKTLPHLPITQSTDHQILWNGTNQNNQPVSSGVYLYQLKLNSTVVSQRKCLLLK